MFFNGRFYARLNHVALRHSLRNDGARSGRERDASRSKERTRDSERRGKIFTSEWRCEGEVEKGKKSVDESSEYSCVDSLVSA